MYEVGVKTSGDGDRDYFVMRFSTPSRFILVDSATQIRVGGKDRQELMDYARDAFERVVYPGPPFYVYKFEGTFSPIVRWIPTSD